MTRRMLMAAAMALVILLVLYDVDVNPELQLARSLEIPDAAQEERFLTCVAERDAVIHEETFATIDNPDVQREVLATRKERAARDCRAAFPARTVTIEEPFHFNLVDLEFRW